jgi:hypothetical protein
MSLSDIVNVQISKQTASVSRVGFGTPMILTYHTKDAARVLEFSDAPSMLVAGGGPFASTDAAYILASKAFSQNPKPSKVLVGRRINPTIRTVVLTPRSGLVNGETLPLNSTLYRVTINGENFDFTTDATATVAEITAGLEALINGGGQNVDATATATELTIEKAVTPGGAATAGETFSLSYDRALMTCEDTTPVAAGGTLADEIAAISNVNDDWYGICGDWYGQTEILAVAAYIETVPKLHGAASSDDNCYDPNDATDTGSLLQGLGYARTFFDHHVTPEAGISAATLGKNLPKDPGSITWKFKTLAGIAPVEYTSGEKTALKNKNIGRYVLVAGVNITCDGKTSSGEFIDITRFVDWLTARLMENVFFRLANSDKVPYTNPGIGVIENEVRGTLNQGISVGGLAADPAPVVTVPNAIVGSEGGVSANDKANRLLPDVDFCATLAGAIHEVEINGKVTL